MSEFFTYIFWPNPPAPAYSSPKVMLALGVCLLMVVCSFAVSRWRKGLQNPVTRKLSASWSAALLWFGLIGLFLAVCRVEGIAFLSMRLFWAVWALALVAYVLLQWKVWRMRHYEIVPQVKNEDPRARYLPKKKH
ncbi:hypothetical protein FJZ28_00525 [Candidatus Peregrinibacteria bacterium]|nr:hypothetical protein [Candidatus Peregrinibacteria bacterium]